MSVGAAISPRAGGRFELDRRFSREPDEGGNRGKSRGWKALGPASLPKSMQ